MSQPIATWNPARGVWEVPQTESLICGHLELYSVTWPNSGTTRNGWAYAPLTSEHPTDDSGSLSLLPTPTTSESTGPGYTDRVNGGGRNLRTEVSLLPTLTSRDGKGANQRGDATCLHGALLPTPAVNDMGEGKTVEHWDSWTATQKEKHGNGNGHGPSLAIEALRLGDPTSPPSDAGSEFSDEQPPSPQSSAPREDNDSPLDLWSS